MTLGFILIVAIGSLWASVGIIFSYVAKNNIDFISFMALSSIASTVVASIAIPKYSLLFTQPSMAYFRVALPTLLAGVATVLGTISMNKAMRMGHHGATWALAQSALTVPFLFGVLAWNDEVQRINIFGFVIILASIYLFGAAKQNSGINKNDNSKWLITSLACLLFFGTQQTLMSLPSRWSDWTDSAFLRVPFIQWGAMLSYNTLMIIQRKKITIKVWRTALLLSGTMISSQLLLFRALDIFAQFSKTAIVFPMGIGVSMILFSLYSFIVIREKATTYHVLGMLIGTLGIVLVAFK